MANGKLLMGLATAAIGGYALWENTAALETTHYCLHRTEHIPQLPNIVQISDLHRRQFGCRNEKLLQAVQQQKPQLIVITGDLISRTVTDFTDVKRLLRRLCGMAPVMMVPGNHELDLQPFRYVEFRQCVRACGVMWLEDQTVMWEGIPFAGLVLTANHYRNGDGYRGLESCTVETLYRRLGPCAPHTVLLAHNPLFFSAYAEWGAALVLSGHVHGGVIRVPMLGGLLSPERRFFPRYAKGVYTRRNSMMIVSAGLGKFRMGNPPEIVHITTQSGRP